MRPPLAPRLLHSWLWSLASLLSLSSLAVEYPQWDGQESIEQYARRTGVEPTKTLDLGNGVKLEMVLVPAGKFTMGTPGPRPVDEAGYRRTILAGQILFGLGAAALLLLLSRVAIRAVRERRGPQYSLGRLLLMTVAAGAALLGGMQWRGAAGMLDQVSAQHQVALGRYQDAHNSEKFACQMVTIAKPYFIGKFEVTQEQYRQLVGKTPHLFQDRDLPVEGVGWSDAQGFCEKASSKTGLTVRLPTEVEWEHACRAGTNTTYCAGDLEADLDRVAWHKRNSDGAAHPVGKKPPNAWGMHDMHGNASEWCLYGDGDEETQKNPQGAPYLAGLLRGGSWDDDPWECRSASHTLASPLNIHHVGFRVAADVPSKAP